MLFAQSTAFIIGPIAKLLGVIINALYNALDFIGLGNIALSIVLFTIIVQLLMIPIKYKAQKFTRVTALVQPEINEIRKKYNGKRDQQSVAMMNQEVKEVYRRYGTSQAGGCLPMIIQLPILFALYGVIQSIPSYINKLSAIFGQVADSVNSPATLQTLSEIKKIADPSKLNKVGIIDYLYTYNISDWHSLVDKVAAVPKHAVDSILSTMKFFGDVLISDTPWTLLREHNFMHWIWILPILVYLSAYFSIKTSQSKDIDSNNPAAKQMKTMSIIMPIMSVYFCFILPVGLGIYWIANSVFMAIQQIYMNRYIDKLGIEKIIEKDVERSKEKLEKQKEKEGINPNRVNKIANISTKNIKNDVEKNQENNQKPFNPSSISSIANLTDKYKDE